MEKTPKNIRVLCVQYLGLEVDRLGKVFCSADEESYIYDLVFVNDFLGAQKSFSSFHPDLVMLDNQFDKATELCAYIRMHEGERHTGIIFTTTQLNKLKNEYALNSSVQCLEKGADDFIRFDVTDRELYARIKAVIKLKLMGDELRKMNHKLEQLSLTDDLTGLANMRCFYQEYAKTITKLRNHQTSVGLIVFDLDKFKLINDTHNHIVGSSVLTSLGKFLLKFQSKYSNMLTARFGGDEFIMMLDGVTENDLARISEEIRVCIEGLEIKYSDLKILITASFGCSFAEEGYKGGDEQLIKIADQMLYESKRKGRNCVSLKNLKNIDESTLDSHKGALVYNIGAIKN